MTDSDEPVPTPARITRTCPSCGTEFEPNRPNKAYCSSLCQKRHSRNSARGNRSGERKARSRQHYERASRLAELIYSTPPSARFGVMQRIIMLLPTDGGLRNIMTDPKLLRQPPRVDDRKNIAQAANAYVQCFFGMSIKPCVDLLRSGQEVEGQAVVCDADAGPKPMTEERLAQLMERKHRELPEKVQEIIAAKRLAAETARETDAERHDRLQLEADVQQAALVTEADMNRVDQIVEDVQARIAARHQAARPSPNSPFSDQTRAAA